MIGVILFDAAFLLAIQRSYVFLGLYIIANIVFMTIYCSKRKMIDCVVFTILFMLFYTWFIDIFIHYLGKKVILEAEFLYLVPLLLTCAKKRMKETSAFLYFSVVYIVFNMFVAIVSGKVDVSNYFRFMVNIMTFVGFYYLFKVIEVEPKLFDLFKFLIACCSLITVLQTVAGFNTDTRNAVFSVFGFGGYSIFIMLFLSFHISKYTLKQESFRTFALIIVFGTILYICTESKAALVLVFVDIMVISAVQRGVSFRKILIVALGVISLPIAYGLLLKFNPKFSYMTTFSTIIRYYTGNNNWRYEYGRFQAIANVFSDQDWFTRMFGVGFGSSTPLYTVLYNELGVDFSSPYYIKKYGYYYGYQHTSISTLLLDGGLILACVIVIMFVVKVVRTLKGIQKDSKNLTESMRLGVLVYLIYYFTYANILKDFRAMAVTAIVFSIKSLNVYTQKDEKT